MTKFKVFQVGWEPWLMLTIMDGPLYIVYFAIIVELY